MERTFQIPKKCGHKIPFEAKFQVDGEAFRLIVEWLYTAQVKIEAKLLEDVRRLCKQCKLHRLENDLEAAVLKAENFGK